MGPSPVDTGRDDLGKVLVLTSAALAAEPWEDLRGIDGAAHKVLWQSGAVVIGLIRVEPGREKPEHTHHGAHHHMLITRGSCVMLGERVDEGSYVYVPPGVPHAVTDVGPEGVEFFYTYRPVEVPPPHADDDFVASPV
ncbi:MAG: cupin domain-containing protein [Frankiales bacterium]|nr:cupin domain-containing protein [Frankiales bacterium]